MYWLIVSPLLLALSIYFIVTDKNDWLYFLGFIAAIIAIVALFLSIAGIFFSCPKEISVFEQQKVYIETHSPTNDVEDAALTSKKVELNDWLYNAQFNKKSLDGWSMYSDKVLELEPIE